MGSSSGVVTPRLVTPLGLRDESPRSVRDGRNGDLFTLTQYGCQERVGRGDTSTTGGTSRVSPCRVGVTGLLVHHCVTEPRVWTTHLTVTGNRWAREEYVECRSVSPTRVGGGLDGGRWVEGERRRREEDGSLRHWVEGRQVGSVRGR